MGSEPVGDEFRVNTYTIGYQQIGSVAMNASGNFVVVWQSHDWDDPYWCVSGRRYDSDGNPLGTDFQINTIDTLSNYFSTTTDGLNPITNFNVAMDDDGGFVVVLSLLHNNSQIQPLVSIAT